MKQLIILCVLMLAIAIDCMVLPSLLFFGIQPSVTLCMVLCIGIKNGRFSGSMGGLCAGLLMDWHYGPSIGYYALQMMLIGYISSAFYIKRFSENAILLAVYTAGVYCCMQLIFALSATMMGARVSNLVLLLLRYIIPSGVLTGLCVIPVNAFVRWLFSFNIMKKKWKISTQ